MASKSRRQLGILGVLALVLVLVLIFNRGPAPSGAVAPSRASRPAPAADRPRDEVEVVRLETLRRARPDQEPATRNPFRFRTVAPPPDEARPSGPAAAAGLPAPPPMPTGPPPPPPITLKFIGLVEQATSHLKVAVLSDGRNVFYGKEGDTIEGRYRIERIGAESIEMAYLDGRGRQTLRLSGS